MIRDMGLPAAVSRRLCLAWVAGALALGLFACAGTERDHLDDPSTMTILFPGWDERSLIPAWSLHEDEP